MTTNIEHEHMGLVRNLFKEGQEILQVITVDHIDLWHAATGCVTEANEMLDAAKKFAVYNKPLDVENLIEEIGDLEFYLGATLQTLSRILGRDVTRGECLQTNITKLRKRYPSGTYTDRDAQQRADKQQGHIGDGQLKGNVQRKFMGQPKEHKLAEPVKVTPDGPIPHPDQTSPMTVPPETFFAADAHPQTKPSPVVYKIGDYTVESIDEEDDRRRYALRKGDFIVQKYPLGELESARADARNMFQRGMTALRESKSPGEHREILQAAGVPVEGDGQEHGEIMKEITGHG